MSPWESLGQGRCPGRHASALFPMESAEKEARRALARLKRAVEKSRREIGSLRGALERAEAEDFPAHEYDEAESGLASVAEWADREGGRLQAKILAAGGLEPGRVRRSSSY